MKFLSTLFNKAGTVFPFARTRELGHNIAGKFHDAATCIGSYISRPLKTQNYEYRFMHSRRSDEKYATRAVYAEATPLPNGRYTVDVVSLRRELTGHGLTGRPSFTESKTRNMQYNTYGSRPRKTFSREQAEKMLQDLNGQFKGKYAPAEAASIFSFSFSRVLEAA